jgi:hypothetical protein
VSDIDTIREALRLVALRLWGDPHSLRCARLVGVQWRRVGESSQ